MLLAFKYLWDSICHGWMMVFCNRFYVLFLMYEFDVWIQDLAKIFGLKRIVPLLVPSISVDSIKIGSLCSISQFKALSPSKVCNWICDFHDFQYLITFEKKNNNINSTHKNNHFSYFFFFVADYIIHHIINTFR